jgi:single-strand DNA-binding protein
MAGEPTVTFTGRLGNDPDINYTKTGRAVANLNVAVTPTTKDGDVWVDKETIWFKVSLWRNAEAAADEFVKGDLVSVAGKFAQANYTTKDGENRTALEVDADYVGLIPTVKAGKKSEGTEAPW